MKKSQSGNILAEIHPIIYRFNKTYLASPKHIFCYMQTQKKEISLKC